MREEPAFAIDFPDGKEMKQIHIAAEDLKDLILHADVLAPPVVGEPIDEVMVAEEQRHVFVTAGILQDLIEV